MIGSLWLMWFDSLLKIMKNIMLIVVEILMMILVVVFLMCIVFLRKLSVENIVVY